ncbi:MAG: hypothetical protein IKG56_00635 [Clostridia bacterium]|nr:hypothetical protein [Clostridia bacterium]
MAVLKFRIAELVENRRIMYENGQFFIINDDALSGEIMPVQSILTETSKTTNYSVVRGEFDTNRISVPGKSILEYLHNTLSEVIKRDDVSVIWILNILDQPIFNAKLWNEQYEKDFLNSISEIVKNYKEELKLLLRINKKGTIEDIKKNREMYGESFDTYLIQLYKEGILDAEILGEVSVFKDFDITRIKELMKSQTLNSTQILDLQQRGLIDRETVIEAFGGIDNVLTMYKRVSRSRNERSALLYLNLLGIDNICILYALGKIQKEDIKRAKVSKKDLEKLPEELFVSVLKRGLPDNIEYSSKEIINQYITKISGRNMIDLAKSGVVEPQDLLELIDEEVDEENKTRAVNSEEIKDFYTPEMVADLTIEEKVDEDFIHRIDEKILANADQEEREEYLISLFELCREGMDDKHFAEFILSMADSIDIPLEVFERNYISDEALEEMFYSEEVSEEKIIEHFNKGIVGLSSIQLIFGNDYDKIIEQVNGGTLSKLALSIIPIRELSDKVLEGKLAIDSIFELYSKFDSIDIDGFEEIVSEYETDYYLRKEEGEEVGELTRIVDLIDEKIGTEKIRELYLHDILTHSDILQLEEKGIITEEQRREISKIDRDRLYKEIFENRVISVFDDEEPDHLTPPRGDLKGGSHHSARIMETKAFFEEIGDCIFKEVESQDAKSQFRGYTLIGYPDYGVIVLENFDEGENATYIMTIEEFKGFISINENGTITFKKGKTAIKDEIARDKGRAIVPRSHVVTWGKNVIDSIRGLSEEARESITTEQQIKLSQSMVEEYYREELESAGEDQEKVENIKSRIELAKAHVENETVRDRVKELKAKRKEIERTTPKSEKGIPNHGEE